jgi:hypothetical protein
VALETAQQTLKTLPEPLVEIQVLARLEEAHSIRGCMLEAAVLAHLQMELLVHQMDEM